MTFPDTPLRIGKVALTVHDLESVSAYYQDVIGLDVLSSEGNGVNLGKAGHVLLELRRNPDARRRSLREAGLFHTAFLVPERADLGRWAQHAADRHFQIVGASDHLVSEAIYLVDPEGNGIEIYADRPRSSWHYDNGMVEMATEPLNFPDLLESAGATRWSGFPEGGVIGHVHLQVGDIPRAESFYTDILGLDLTCRYPGGSFFSSGGYHHHIATNIWNSRGAPVRAYPVTGLLDVEFKVRQESILYAVQERAQEAGIAVESRGESRITVQDPWGIALTLSLEQD